MEKIYPYAVSKIKMFENTLFNQNQLMNLVNQDINKIFSQMQEHKYVISVISKPEEFEIILKKEYSKLYSLIKKMMPEERFTDLFLIKNDYHNIKVFLKYKIAKEDYQNINKMFQSKNEVDNQERKKYKEYLAEDGILKVEELEDIIIENKLEKLPKQMNAAITNTIKAIYGINNKSQMIDILLDKACFEHMMDIAVETKNEFVIKYVEHLCNLTNIKIFIRIKKHFDNFELFTNAYINAGTMSKKIFNDAFNEDYITRLKQTEYKKIIENVSKHGANMEKEIDNYIMNFIKPAKLKALTIEPIVAYIYAKETEIKNLRIILTGKINKISDITIKERLRDAYV